MFRRVAGGGAGSLRQENLTGVSGFAALSQGFSLQCHEEVRSSRQTAKQTGRAAGARACLQLGLVPAPPACRGAEPLPAVCKLAMGTQHGPIPLVLYQETGLDLTV